MTSGLDVYQPTLAVVRVGGTGMVSRVATPLWSRVPLSNLMAVQKTGWAGLVMLSIKSGGWPEGGRWRAR
jgi:hypothetical protein